MATLWALFRYKNNRLQAEYAFRREVLEKTGVILIDKKDQAILPAGDNADAYSVAQFIDSGPGGEARQLKALPSIEVKATRSPDSSR